MIWPISYALRRGMLRRNANLHWLFIFWPLCYGGICPISFWFLGPWNICFARVIQCAILFEKIYNQGNLVWFGLCRVRKPITDGSYSFDSLVYIKTMHRKTDNMLWLCQVLNWSLKYLFREGHTVCEFIWKNIQPRKPSIVNLDCSIAVRSNSLILYNV